MSTTVVHCKHSPYDVYIGRRNGKLPESKWANPYVIGKHGTRDEAISRYEVDVRANPTLMAQLSELKDKVLGCWCKGTDGVNDVPCHGDVLARLVAEIESPKRDVLAIFTSTYSYGESNLTLEEAGKTKPGNPTSIVDLAREHHLKQVVVVDSRIDGALEAFKNLSKEFKATPPKTLADYLKEEQGEAKEASDEHRAKAEKSLREAAQKYEREKSWSTEPIQLIYGLKLTIVPDMAVKTPESHANESSVVVFMRDAVAPTGMSPSYIDLVKIQNLARTTGLYNGKGRLDWAALKRLWTPNLILALPFFSSFIARNLLTFASIVPDLPAKPWVLKEVESHLPFESLINGAIEAYVAANEATVQEVKTIYYRDAAAFTDYVGFRARNTRSKGKSGTFSAPGVDNLCSDQFSFEAFQRLIKS